MTTAHMDKLGELIIDIQNKQFSNYKQQKQKQYGVNLTDIYRHKVMKTAHMNKLGELIIYIFFFSFFFFYKQQKQYWVTHTDIYRHKMMTTAHMGKLGELITYQCFI